LSDLVLITGATGQVGSALVSRLVERGTPVRCLVRDPKRLGPERVRVQIALGDLTDPPSFRNAMRGVGTVVHLAASGRDQPGGSIEELNAIATWRMVDAAERAKVDRFVYFSALGATTIHRTRLRRSKALAERVVRESDLPSTIFAPSLLFARGGRWLDAHPLGAQPLGVTHQAAHRRAALHEPRDERRPDLTGGAGDQDEVGHRIDLGGPGRAPARPGRFRPAVGT
jgi:NADH dehydrogenase